VKPRSLICIVVALAVGSVGRAETPAVTATLDRQLREEWQKKGITPAPRVEDAQFLRRVYVDITGTLPPPERVSAFLEDRDPNKRAQAIDQLLSSDAYARHWADYWDAILMGRLTAEAFIDRGVFKEWLRTQFAQNTPWHKIVYQLVTAEGYNTDKAPKNAKGDPADWKERYNPATNWFLRYSKAIPELSGATAKTFLGVRIQCAQCHDHKTEKWTQEDFRQFTAFFARTWPAYYDKTLVVGTHRLDVRDRPTPPPTGYEQFFGSYKEYTTATPKLLQGKEVNSARSRRVELANWMTATENPWFAKALVNRMWARLLGQGFVEPIDDFRPSNPAVLPQTLQTLADDFVAHGYDLRHLLRAICNTEAYQRACRAPGKPGAHALWSRFPLKSLDIEVLMDVVLQATDAGKFLDKTSQGKLPQLRIAFVRQFVTQLGTDDMAEVTQSEEALAQALLFLNGSLINGTTRLAPELALGAVMKASSDDRQRVEQLYLRTLSRRPSTAETDTWLAYLKQPRDLVKTAGPGLPPPGKQVNPAIANADKDADFKELLKHARAPADFEALRKRMRNNADAALLGKAYGAWIGEYPFLMISTQGGGKTATEQAYENLFWALLNSSEFLSNH
jgi:hypothetical protein